MVVLKVPRNSQSSIVALTQYSFRKSQSLPTTIATSTTAALSPNVQIIPQNSGSLQHN